MNPSENLIVRIEQIECGSRLMVPSLVSRVKKVQGGFVGRVAEKWAACEGKKKAFEEALKVQMEEILGVFVDANRLRSVIIEIVNATDVYQGALFLEGLAQCLVGFKDLRSGFWSYEVGTLSKSKLLLFNCFAKLFY
ncbi:hypothetical protein CRYUN_Cryun07bG0168500 [Craigia yunnanensis]